MLKPISILLTAALVITAPGPAAYQAAAQNFTPRKGTPVNGIGAKSTAGKSPRGLPPANGYGITGVNPPGLPSGPAPASDGAEELKAALPAALPEKPEKPESPGKFSEENPSGEALNSASGGERRKKISSMFRTLKNNFINRKPESVDPGEPANTPAADHSDAPKPSGLIKAAAAGAQSNAQIAAPSVPRPQDEKVKLPRAWWGLFWGHNVITMIGINFHMISQPFLVQKTLGKGTALMGFIRNVHMGSMSLVNLLPIGLLIDKMDYRTLFISTSLFRAMLMGAIPLLFLAGHLPFAVLTAIVAINPLFQSTMVAADSAARKTFLGKNEKVNKEAAALSIKFSSLSGMILPILASYGVGLLVSTFGLGGYAIAYGVYSLMLLASVPIYWYMLEDPRQNTTSGLNAVKDFLKGIGILSWAAVKGVFITAPVFLAKAVYKLAASAGPAKQESVDFREKLARVLDNYEATKGAAYILRNKTLRILIIVGAIEAFLADAMPMVVLPNYIIDVVGQPGAGAAAIPILGTLVATSGGIFGLMLAAEHLAGYLTSWFMQGKRGDNVIKRWGHAAFYRIAAAGSLLFWLMWLLPTVIGAGHFWANLGVVMAVQFGMHMLHVPVGIVMAPVLRKAYPDDDNLIGRVDSTFNMINLMFMAVGALLSGLMLDFLSIKTAMLIMSIAITGTAIMEWLVPRWIFPDGRSPAAKDTNVVAIKLELAFA